MGYDAALVSLDLARLLAAEGCTDDLKRLAAELMPVFESRDVHREAIVALLIFQRACEEERLTVELVQQLAAYLRQGAPGVRKRRREASRTRHHTRNATRAASRIAKAAEKRSREPGEEQIWLVSRCESFDEADFMQVKTKNMHEKRRAKVVGAPDKVVSAVFFSRGRREKGA